MSYTVDNVDILRDISANSITFKNSDTNAFIGCVNDSTYYTPNNTFVDFDFSDKSSASNKRPLLINPWSDGASGGVVIGSRDASSLKGFTGGNYMLDVNGMIKCSTPATTSNDTSVATTAFVKAQSYITSLSGYATETWVNGKGYITSLSGYATETWVNGKGYLKSSSLSDASISDVISTNVECITVKLGGGGKWLIQDEHDKLVFRFVNQTTGVSTVQGIFNPP
jgi:hypothetical protein